MWTKWLQISVWSVLCVATCILLMAAMQKKEEKGCSGIEVNIGGARDNVFIDSKDIAEIVKENGVIKGKEISTINLRNIEEQLEKNAWIKKADLFFDNKQVLNAKIEEREPIARIFTASGKSYYIDSSCKMLPLSDERSARVPMFTSFPNDKKKLSKLDSAVMQDIKTIAQYINDDSFLTAQVAQIDITQKGTYEIIPVLGNQIIRIGDANDLDEKFQKLNVFYKQVWATTGFEKYETIDVQFKKQVVATKRGSAKVYADTTKAMREFGNTAKEMKAAMNDTAFAVEVVKPVQTKDSVQMKKPVTARKPIITTKQNHSVSSKQVKKQVKKDDKQNGNKKEPKAVMPRP